MLIFTACFGAWELGPQHGFARISKWNCSKSPTTVSREVLSVRTLIQFVFREMMVMSVPLLLSLTQRLQGPCGMATSIELIHDCTTNTGIILFYRFEVNYIVTVKSTALVTELNITNVNG